MSIHSKPIGIVIEHSSETDVTGKFPVMTVRLSGSGQVAKMAKIDAIFGITGEKKPYRGNLVGNIRIKYRMNDYAKIYIRDPYRIREYLLSDKGDYVTTGELLSENQRTEPRKTNL